VWVLGQGSRVKGVSIGYRLGDFLFWVGIEGKDTTVRTVLNIVRALLRKSDQLRVARILERRIWLHV
jgi:hypothetical protein